MNTHASKITPVISRLESSKSTCPLVKTHMCLAGCSEGPLTILVHVAIETFLGEWAELGMHWDAWIAEVERARASFAALIGAQPAEIAVGGSVSQLVSSVASALLASPPVTRRRIVSSV